jgi:hypothetical protein
MDWLGLALTFLLGVYIVYSILGRQWLPSYVCTVMQPSFLLCRGIFLFLTEAA